MRVVERLPSQCLCLSSVFVRLVKNENYFVGEFNQAIHLMCTVAQCYWKFKGLNESRNI